MTGTKLLSRIIAAETGSKESAPSDYIDLGDGLCIDVRKTRPLYTAVLGATPEQAKRLKDDLADISVRAEIAFGGVDLFVLVIKSAGTTSVMRPAELKSHGWDLDDAAVLIERVERTREQDRRAQEVAWREATV